MLVSRVYVAWCLGLEVCGWVGSTLLQEIAQISGKGLRDGAVVLIECVRMLLDLFLLTFTLGGLPLLLLFRL